MAGSVTAYAIVNVMSTNVKIEVDERTADVLRARAAELGVTRQGLAKLMTRLGIRE